MIGSDDAEQFYAREKRRLARLTALVAAKLGPRPDVIATLVEFIAFWASDTVRMFFEGPGVDELKGTLAAARRLGLAPAGSGPAKLREGYFRYYLERQTDLDMDAVANEFQLCDAVLGYFTALAAQRPAATVPVGTALAARLGRDALSLGDGRAVDALTACAIIHDKPNLPLERPAGYDEFAWWYLAGLIGAWKIPPDCFRPEIVAYLNEAVLGDAFSGIDVTRFLKLAWSKSDAFRQTFDLGSLIDRSLFVVTLIVTVLARNTQYIPLFAPFLLPARAPGGLFDLLIQRLVRGSEVDSPRITFLDAVRGTMPPPKQPRDSGARQDILLIGHASKGTGLGRNYGMLMRALSTDRNIVTGLDFDARDDAIHEGLTRWFATCRSHPVVVLAVNAHDAPEIFAKDRNGILFDCYKIGFFLWEVSRMPRIQELGVGLVDEIWAPTAYVADVYRHAAPTHVIGKGLFSGDEDFLTRSHAAVANTAFTFATVFDFDSSIERKNPLAVVQAFQKAFHSDEKVALIVKGSNVNPQHWSNASRHWQRLVEACAGDPRIKLVTTRYTNDEMTALVRDSDCIVSLHRAEGFGYLMSDAMAFGTPVIATNYSGNVDFCSADTAFPVAYRLVPVPPGQARWHCDDAEWADADVDAAAAQMRSVFENHDAALRVAQNARREIVRQYSLNAFRNTLSQRMAAITDRLAAG